MPASVWPVVLAARTRHGAGLAPSRGRVDRACSGSLAPARPASAFASDTALQTILIVLAVAGLVAVVAHGALATESRHWDGVVAWDLKAKALAAEPTLEQPFFRDAAVYSHSRDYPLLQPLALALAERWGLPGRLLFPAA
jgi:hypothetical protein